MHGIVEGGLVIGPDNGRAHKDVQGRSFAVDYGRAFSADEVGPGDSALGMGRHADAAAAQGGDASLSIGGGQGAKVLGAVAGVLGEEIGPGLGVDVGDGPQ